ncbi:hypothetical protein J5226_21245 [Lysobacter sp. K5869]|uniref:hypothetical protein n=1 Tax=Lysobacter sp. K5869 TaxID=2820808 RepID=UPI001C0642D5|nr:hypothetical protein [Lysobacter sp. K5869]QWP76091.1 hypothetical protein J5226_21245 [Lysobacter sp. K5869]
MTVADWLTALVALVTALAMLKDAPAHDDVRVTARAILRGAWTAFRAAGVRAIDGAALGALARYAARLLALVGVVAGAGVIVLQPVLGVAPAPDHERVLRAALCVLLALQVPCPWWRYVAHGHPRLSRSSLRSRRRNAVH